jgi:DNA-binding CsgD family transcriptional regulator
VPFIIDEDMAKLSAMLLDGFVDKHLRCISFSQKKDIEKITEFRRILKEKLGAHSRLGMTSNETPTVVAGKTTAHFMHHILDIYKCDENGRIPRWLWNSPIGVVNEYVKYAFAMEGSVCDPSVGKYEVKFHSCDESYVKEFAKLLWERFGMKSYIQKYFIKNYGWKYYVSLTGKDNLIKFSKIGSAYTVHQRRIRDILERYASPKRTYARQNEANVLKLLESGTKYTSQIAREIGVPRQTVRTVLERLRKEGKIELVTEDRFQRKFWKIKN